MFNIFSKNVQISDILASFYGSFLMWLIILIIGAIWAQNKKIFLPFVYKFFGKFVFNAVRWTLRILASVYLRFALIALFLFLINIYFQNILLFSIIIFILTLSIPWKPRTKMFFNPAGKISDSFEDEDVFEQNWEVKTGSPEINNDFGKPAPDLELKRVRARGTHSFVWLRDIQSRSGIIECDFNLEPGGLLNIVFFADKDNDNWYMARFDSRRVFSDGLFVKDRGYGNNWEELRLAGTTTEARKWFRARVEFNEKVIKMFKNGELIAQFDAPRIFGEGIGIFNEVNDVHVDNFLFIES